MSLGSWARSVLGFFGRRASAPQPAAPVTATAPSRPAPLPSSLPLGSAEAGQLSALLRELARTPADGQRGDWDAALVPGNQVGRFRLVRELGRGGFGRVWEAEEEGGRRVALKALRRDVHPALREERLLQEADVAARLSHPAIAPVLAAGTCPHGPWLALELLHGETLAQRLERAPLPPAEALRVARAIAGGVAHAHAKGVVHRDLKPANVFACDGGQVKLLDFGLAHAFGTVRAAGGTPAYMAPEQWRGAPEDERSDVFSLGVILHQLLCGALPFAEGAGKAVERGRRAPRLQVAGAPQLGRLVARMLERDPVARPRHGQEVLEELAKVDAGALGEVRVLPAPRRWPGKATPRAAALWGAGLLGLAIAAWSLGQRPPPLPAIPLPAQLRLAVLPLDEVGVGPAEAALAAGLVERVTEGLRRLEALREALRVVAPQEVLRQQVRSPRDAWDAFQANLALTGKLTAHGERLHIQVQLVDARSSDLLAALDVDAPRGDEQALEQKLVTRVAEALRLEVAGAGQGPREPVAAPGAYEFYLQGRGYLQRYDREENLESAVQVFDRALEKDPGYAPAWAGKAEALLRRYRLTREPSWLEEARSAARQGRELGEGQAAVHLALGLVHGAAGEHADAIRSYQRALELEPRSAEALRELAATLEAAGRPEEAEAAFRRAIELRPDSWAAYNNLGVFCFLHGRFDEAATLFQRVVELVPDSYRGYQNLGAVQLARKREEEAARALERSVALHPSADAFGNLGTLRFFQRRYDEAATFYQRAADLAPADAERWADLGHARLHGGQADQARQPYRRAVMLLEREVARSPRDGVSWSRLAMVEGASGARRASLDHIARALSLQPRAGKVQFQAALVFERAGLRERALAAVRAAVAAGHPRVELDGAPSLAALRADARYARAVSPPVNPQ